MIVMIASYIFPICSCAGGWGTRGVDKSNSLTNMIVGKRGLIILGGVLYKLDSRSWRWSLSPMWRLDQWHMHFPLLIWGSKTIQLYKHDLVAWLGENLSNLSLTIDNMQIHVYLNHALNAFSLRNMIINAYCQSSMINMIIYFFTWLFFHIWWYFMRIWWHLFINKITKYNIKWIFILKYILKKLWIHVLWI